jgi:hypothetical protein
MYGGAGNSNIRLPCRLSKFYFIPLMTGYENAYNISVDLNQYPVMSIKAPDFGFRITIAGMIKNIHVRIAGVFCR